MRKFCLFAILTIASMNLFSQVNWVKQEGNPVMTANAESWEDPMLLPGSVIFHEGEYHMWYSGGDFLANGGFFRIGHATSIDGIAWTRDLLPVLDTGSMGEWDDKTVWEPTVLLKDGVFHMWYSGHGNVDASGHGDDEIGHAISTDGIIWVKDEKNPVFKEGNQGTWDDPVVVAPSVIYDGSMYHMYYHASSSPSNGSIGHATSPDGTTWTRDPQNPVISKGIWDTPQTVYGSALHHNNTFQMWYTGGSFLAWDIGYATSEDGSSWTRYGDGPVLNKASEGFGSKLISAPSVIYDTRDTLYKMWYSGQGTDGTFGIGYAESDPFVFITDTAFLIALIETGVDANGDRQISYTEAQEIISLDLSDRGISDITGIEAFVNLDSLSFNYNQLTDLDVSKNTALRILECYGNELTNLDLTNNIDLVNLNIGISSGLYSWCCDDGNLITHLDVSNNKLLTSLSCANNKLTSLDLSNNRALVQLRCAKNSLSSLDLSKNVALAWLECFENNLDSLNVANNTALTHVFCFSNQISKLDVSNNVALRSLDCGENPLTWINVSNNTGLESLSLHGISTTCDVCVWTTPFSLSEYADIVNIYNSPDIHFTADCSTEIEDLSTEKHTIYPNPTEEFITINTEFPGKYLVEISAINGQKIYSNTLEGTHIQIDLSSFKKGAYFITIGSKDRVITSKIIKL